MPQNENTASMIESFDQVKDTLPGAWLLDTRSNAIRSFEAQDTRRRGPKNGSTLI